MKKFWQEFKKFISRGNVMDMAVGTIIGAAFTAIVTALSNGILKPVINMVIYYCCGGNKDALDKMYTVLVKVTKIDSEGNQVLDLANSIYIDWGAFISAIINFFLVALVLFFVIKGFNTLRDQAAASAKIENRIKFKQEKGIKLNKKELAYLETKQKEQEELASMPAPEPVKDPVVSLLEEIRDSLTKDKE